MSTDYSKSQVPSDYVCEKCGATNVKLWRSYSSFTVELQCALCAAEEQHKDIATMDADGRPIWEEGRRTDAIGWMVPAVPTPEGDSYWGYTSVPDDGVSWWRALTTLPSMRASLGAPAQLDADEEAGIDGLD